MQGQRKTSRLDGFLLLLNGAAAVAGISVLPRLGDEVQRRVGSGTAIGLYGLPYLCTIGVLIAMQLFLALVVRDVDSLASSVEQRARTWLTAVRRALQTLRIAMAVSSILLWAAIPLSLVPATQPLGLGLMAAVAATLIAAIGAYVYQQWTASRLFQQWALAGRSSGSHEEDAQVGLTFRDARDARFLVIRKSGAGVAFNTAHPRFRWYLALLAVTAVLILLGLVLSGRA